MNLSIATRTRLSIAPQRGGRITLRSLLTTAVAFAAAAVVAATFGVAVGYASAETSAPPIEAASLSEAGLDQLEPARGHWQLTAGGFGWLRDVVAFGSDDIWAVGDGIAQFDGDTWTQVGGVNAPYLLGIDGSSAEDLWIVGASGEHCGVHGVMFHRDAGGWQPVDVPTHQVLYDIDMLSPTDGWAVGGWYEAVILEYDGDQWTRASAPEIDGLRSVHMVSSTDGWAVGESGAVAHYNGLRWEEVSVPTQGSLWDVSFFDSARGWAVGSEGSSGIILAYENGRWVVETDWLPFMLMTVTAVAPREAFASGSDGVLLMYNGERWREIGRTYPGGLTPLTEFECATNSTNTLIADPNCDPLAEHPGKAQAVPVVGLPVLNADDSPGNGLGAQPDWHEFRPEFGLDRFWDEGPMLWGSVLLPNGEDLVLVGDNGQIVTIEVLVPREIRHGWLYTAIDMLSADHGWAVSINGPPMRWDGARWHEAEAPLRLRRFLDVAAVSPSEAWAVGHRGRVARWQGDAWEELEPFTYLELESVAFSGPSDGWIIANDSGSNSGESRGVIFHWDGTAWREVMNLCNSFLYDVAAGGPRDVWFATREARLLHYDGASWNWIPVDDPSGFLAGDFAWRSIDVSDSSGWAVAGRFAARRVGPESWRLLDEPLPLYLRSGVVAVDGDTAWGIDNSRTPVMLSSDGQVVRAPLQVREISALDALAEADGNHQVWAVGSGGTVAHLSSFASDQPLSPAAPTPALPTAVPFPTPTVASRYDPQEVVDFAKAHSDGYLDDWDVARVELLSLGEAEDEIASMRLEYGSYITYGGRSEPCWRAAWILEFNRPILPPDEAAQDYACGGGNVYAIAFSETAVGSGSAYFPRVGRCGIRWHGVAHVPAVYTYRLSTPAPPPPTPIIHAKATAVNGMHGPCPSPTPRPTPNWPGYPGP